MVEVNLYLSVYNTSLTKVQPKKKRAFFPSLFHLLSIHFASPPPSAAPPFLFQSDNDGAIGATGVVFD